MAYKDDIIAELRAVVDDLKRQIGAQAIRIAELELQLAKALKNSSNSSKSPSSDIVKPQKKVDRRKKAKRGGQKGHPRMLRESLPRERVNEEIIYEIDAADVRELGLTATDDFEIVQHIELLDLPSGSFASAVFSLASSRRNDGGRSSPFDDHPSRSFSRSRSKTAGFTGSSKLSRSFSNGRAC